MTRPHTGRRRNEGGLWPLIALIVSVALGATFILYRSTQQGLLSEAPETKPLQSEGEKKTLAASQGALRQVVAPDVVDDSQEIQAQTLSPDKHPVAISGLVLDSVTGEGIEGALVELRNHEGSIHRTLSLRAPGSLTCTTKTDQRGYFRVETTALENLRLKTFAVRIESDGYLSKRMVPDRQSFAVGPGALPTVFLQPAAKLSVSLRSESGSPIPGAQIYVFRLAPPPGIRILNYASFDSRTDRNGNCELYTDQHHTDLTLVALAPGFIPYCGELNSDIVLKQGVPYRLQVSSPVGSLAGKTVIQVRIAKLRLKLVIKSETNSQKLPLSLDLPSLSSKELGKVTVTGEHDVGAKILKGSFEVANQESLGLLLLDTEENSERVTAQWETPEVKISPKETEGRLQQQNRAFFVSAYVDDYPPAGPRFRNAGIFDIAANAAEIDANSQSTSFLLGYSSLYGVFRSEKFTPSGQTVDLTHENHSDAFGTLSIEVVDSQGAPIEYALVEILLKLPIDLWPPISFRSPGAQEVALERTGSDAGRILIPSAPFGQHRVRVSFPGHETVSQELTHSPSLDVHRITLSEEASISYEVSIGGDLSALESSISAHLIDGTNGERVAISGGLVGRFDSLPRGKYFVEARVDKGMLATLFPVLFLGRGGEEAVNVARSKVVDIETGASADIQIAVANQVATSGVDLYFDPSAVGKTVAVTTISRFSGKPLLAVRSSRKRVTSQKLTLADAVSGEIYILELLDEGACIYWTPVSLPTREVVVPSVSAQSGSGVQLDLAGVAKPGSHVKLVPLLEKHELSWIGFERVADQNGQIDVSEIPPGRFRCYDLTNSKSKPWDCVVDVTGSDGK